MKILGIETTCDETGAAIVEDGRIVVSNIVASQADLHTRYGGIVPELASRKHLEFLPFVTNEALKKANLELSSLDAISVSKEPGLPPALSVGYAYASGLSLSSSLPLIEVNHMDAHVHSIWIVDDKNKLDDIPYPYICLLVSGGHTELRLISDKNRQKTIGSTRDDAAGEAFDKVARILSLGYPGGPAIDTISKSGDETTYRFPRPMIESDDFDFSFSGLKTAVKRKVLHLKEECSEHKENKALYEELCSNWKSDVAASFQEAVVEVLVAKTITAASDLGIETIAIAGGVSANSRLREIFGRSANSLGFKIYYPKLKYCGDNAAMVAANAFYHT